MKFGIEIDLEHEDMVTARHVVHLAEALIEGMKANMRSSAVLPRILALCPNDDIAILLEAADAADGRTINARVFISREPFETQSLATAQAEKYGIGFTIDKQQLWI